MTTTKLANEVESAAIRPLQVNVPEAELIDFSSGAAEGSTGLSSGTI